MRKIKLYIATSIDSKIARKDHTIDWLPELPTEGEQQDDYGYQQLIDSIDTTLMGFKTYEVCLGLGEWPYKEQTNYIFSRNATRELIPEAQLITEDPVEFTRKLKQSEGKDIWLIGGGEIIALLHDAGLIDEYILAFIPIILGEGIALFPGISKEQQLHLKSHQVYPNGLALFITRNARHFTLKSAP